MVAPGSVGIQTYESIAEIDYGMQLRRWLKIRSNLQYVINPGGTGKIPNAFVIGPYTEVTFGSELLNFERVNRVNLELSAVES